MWYTIVCSIDTPLDHHFIIILSALFFKAYFIVNDTVFDLLRISSVKIQQIKVCLLLSFAAKNSVRGNERITMAVHRKSNWYIYFIAFGIAMAFAIMVIFTFRWYLFPEKSEEVGINSAGELSDSFKPLPEHSFVVLVMLSEGSLDAPELYIMAEYDAVESRVTFVPLPNGVSMSDESRTLPNVYDALGCDGVVNAVEKAVGVDIDSYVRFDRESFTDFMTSYGNVTYNVPKTMIIKDGVAAETLNAGERLFTGDMMYRYIMLAEFPDGESYRFNIIGELLAETMNQNCSDDDSSLLDTYAGLLMKTPENNITEDKYNTKKAALLNTAIYGVSPAEYYVPYGEYTENGGFDISENSVITIKQKAGQD